MCLYINALCAQFSVFLGLIFILEFAAGISGYVLRADTEALLTKSLNHTLYEYNQKEYDYITLGWDEIQRDVSGSPGMQIPDSR